MPVGTNALLPGWMVIGWSIAAHKSIPALCPVAACGKARCLPWGSRWIGILTVDTGIAGYTRFKDEKIVLG